MRVESVDLMMKLSLSFKSFQIKFEGIFAMGSKVREAWVLSGQYAGAIMHDANLRVFSSAKK